MIIVKGAAWNRNFQPWKVVMVWCAGSSCVSLWDGRCAIRNRKKRGEKQESWVYWVMREHEYGMEPGPEHVRQVEQREFPLLTHGAFCSHHPSPQCSLSLFAALWCHPTPLTSFTACSRRGKRKTIWAVFFTKSAVVGWAIKYTQMNSGSDVFQTLNVSGAGARWSKW